MKKLLVLLLGSLVIGAAAQTPDPWPSIFEGERYVFDWVQDPVCTDGKPITECPISGYYMQAARPTLPDVWNNVSTNPMAASARQYVWTANLPAGQTCFRVQVLNSAGYDQSPPSNIQCVVVKRLLKKGAQPPTLSSHPE